MRLFTALDLPGAMVGGLDAFLARLRPKARIAWSKPGNLHITTKFIGEWPEARVDEVKAALAGVPARPAIAVHVRRVGFFPNPQAPKNFWCGVDAPGIEQLAKDTDIALGKIGVNAEERRYLPHLTLARIKERVEMQPLREAIAEESAQNGLDFGSFEAAAFFLYVSQMKPGGSVYTKLAEFPFFLK